MSLREILLGLAACLCLAPDCLAQSGWSPGTEGTGGLANTDQFGNVLIRKGLAVGTPPGAPGVGDVDISGQYKVNGVPVTSGTPMSANGANAVEPAARQNLLPAGTTAVVYAKDFGCVWDAATGSDVGPCISAAAVAAATFPAGACVILPSGSFSTKTEVAITTSVCLLGAGSSVVAGVTGTELIWNGSASGRMMSVIAPSGSTANKRLNNVKISGITFNGNAGLAADGLYLASLYRPRISGVSFIGGFNGGVVLNLDVVAAANGSTFGEPPDLQKGYFPQIDIRQAGYTSVPLRLAAKFNGGVWANASYNDFSGLSIIGNGAVTGILCVGCDNNTFDQTNIASTTASVDMAIAASGGNLFAANSNIFRHYLGSGSFINRGQTTTPACVAVTLPLTGTYGTCTYANRVEDLDRSNGAVNPTYETGALAGGWEDTLSVSLYHAFFGTNNLMPGAVIGNDAGDYNVCQQAARTNAGNNNSVYLCNSATGDLAQFDNLAGSRFGMLNDASSAAGNLVFRRNVGTGHYIFRDTPIATDNFLVSQLPACNAGLKGSLLAVSDATAPTYNAAVVGGGAVQVLAQCNGTAWTAH